MEQIKLLYCEHCKKIVELLPGSHGCPTKCCGEPMKELEANTVEASKEKHIPVVNIEENKVTVKIGEVPHPMMDIHYINFVYLVTDKNTYRHMFKPTDKPETTFTINDDEKVCEVYEYCNLHGLWKKVL